ncbi:PAS domain S-box protein [Mucilaginibacter sp. PAMB04168]|uniref:PAS domain S-box protein n=1 Tax=Mucilaginibacter sp. PAMB04168 TaxID=3138567 RepID=UPI0031F61294
MRLGPGRIAIIYLVTCSVWIALSDQVLFLFQGTLSPSLMYAISSSKGVFFVIATSGFLYHLVKVNNQHLINTENQYRLMYEGSPTPKWIYDLQTLKFVSVNQAAIDKYGYTREQFLSMSILDIRPPDDKQKVLESAKSVSNHLRQTVGWIHQKADGTPIHVNIISQKIKFNNKPHVIITAQDITEKVNYEQELKKLNEDLKEEKRKLSETQQVAKIGGWEFYISEKHLVWSDEMYIITQVEKDAELNLFELYEQQIHPDDRPAMTAQLNKLIKTGEQLDVTHRITWITGETRWVRELARLELKDGLPYKAVGSAQDITELKEMELERNRYLFSLEDTLDNINEGFYALNKDLVFTKVNKRFQLETGIKAEDVIGKDIVTAFPGIEKRITYQQYQKVLAERISVKFEAYWRHFKKWHAVQAYPTEDGIAVYFDDITEKKEKDALLQQAISRYEAVAKATRDVIYDYDILQDKLVFYTDVTKLINCADTDIGQGIKWWRSLIHPDDLHRVVNTQHEVMAAHETNWRGDYRVSCGKGNYKHVYSQGYYLYNEQQQPVRVIGAIKDVDELKRANEENKRLAEIITKVNNMIVVMDTHHNITWVNKAFEDYVGYKLEDIKGRSVSSFLGGEKISVDIITEIKARKERLETFSMDMLHYLPNGNKQWVNIEYTPLFDECGTNTGYIAVHQNITDRKQREEKIYYQNRALQEVSWLSSHEIRRPVASILGLAYLAKDAQSRDEEKQIIDMINRCAEELDGIVHNISNKINEELFGG